MSAISTTRWPWRAVIDRLRPVPALRWILLPPYEIPDMAVVCGVLVENSGQKSAHNVKIEISYGWDGERVIHHMEVVSDEPYIVRGGGSYQSFVTLRLREMRAGSLVVVYISSRDHVSPTVSVTSYEKALTARVQAGVSDEPGQRDNLTS